VPEFHVIPSRDGKNLRIHAVTGKESKQMSTEYLFDEMQVDVDEAELAKILEEGDPEKIAALMSGKPLEEASAAPEAEGDDLIVEDEEAAEVDASTETENKQGENRAAPGAEVDEPAAQTEEEAYIESKSGGNKIPYAVLEATRTERNELRKQNQELNDKLAEFQNSSARVTKVLEKNGIDLSALERGEVLDDEQLRALDELDPVMGKAARMTMALQDQVKQLSEQLQQKNSAPAEKPEVVAFKNNPDLVGWFESDPDRWDMAKRYDELLQKDPAFEKATPAERFAEVVKRTKALFNDPVTPATQETNTPKTVEQKAAEKIAAAGKRPQVPTSLTDVGSTPQTERSVTDLMLDEEDPDKIAAKMAVMSRAQLKNLLVGVELVG
jgi:hypothetical protein